MPSSNSSRSNRRRSNMGPEPIIWRAHYKAGTVKFRNQSGDEPPAITFFCELTKPDRERGRLIEVEFTHDISLEAIIKDLVWEFKERGKFLPDEMG